MRCYQMCVKATMLMMLVGSMGAYAQNSLSRCPQDSLGPNAVEARLQWARRCSLTVNVKNPEMRVNTGSKSSSGEDLYDYDDKAANVPDFEGTYRSNVYWTYSDDYRLNTGYAKALCNNVQNVKQSRTDAGDLKDFYLWSCNTKKRIFSYPIYASEPDRREGTVQTRGIQLFPHPALMDCDLYKDKEGKVHADTNPQGQRFYAVVSCTAGNTACNSQVPPTPPVNTGDPQPKAVPATLLPAPAALCAGDTLSRDQVKARLDWARTCSLMKSAGNAFSSFDTGVPASNKGNLQDYLESAPNGRNSYWGQLRDSYINDSYVFALYNNGPTSQAIQACGPANGYYLWSRPDTFNGRSLRRAQPMYPVYGNKADRSSPGFKQLFPAATTPASCDLYEDKQGTTKASEFYVVGYCVAPRQ